MRTLRSQRVSIGRIADSVAATVGRGGTAIFPTDTVYGIGCDPWREDAVARVYELKRRGIDKPLTLHLASVDELLEYAPGLALAAELARAFLPGPLTLVVPRLAFLGSWLAAGRSTIGLRVPKHPVCAAILERCGPLAATSANYSGRPAFTGGDPSDLPRADLCIDDGAAPLGIESTIIDVSGDEPRVLREGAIGIDMLEAVLNRRVCRPETETLA